MAYSIVITSIDTLVAVGDSEGIMYGLKCMNGDVPAICKFVYTDGENVGDAVYALTDYGALFGFDLPTQEGDIYVYCVDESGNVLIGGEVDKSALADAVVGDTLTFET